MMIKNHRTLTCAPTNTAVVEVASRVLGLIEDPSSGSENNCFLSDVVMFGNEDPSSSSRLLYLQKAEPFDLLVVDEAAQLKECESLIPLQISGICLAVLIGAECQLPALVKSKVILCS
jgi:hypothetical protein